MCFFEVTADQVLVFDRIAGLYRKKIIGPRLFLYGPAVLGPYCEDLRLDILPVTPLRLTNKTFTGRNNLRQLLNQKFSTTDLCNPQIQQQANSLMVIAHPFVTVLPVFIPIDVVVTVLQVVFRDPVVLTFTAHGSHLYHASFE